MATPFQPRFGVQITGQHVTWDEYIDAVRAIESYGYDSLWTFDHLLPVSGSYAGPAFETITTLTAVASATSRVRIGALVFGVLYRDPATLAKMAAMIDIISGGRLEFSLGAAWAQAEFRAYGLPFPSARERVERLDEALYIVKALWTQEQTTFHGRYYNVDQAYFSPKPLQQPHPPIMVGGGGERLTLRVVAKHANTWNVIGSPSDCRHKISVLEEHCREIGRDSAEIEKSTHPRMWCAPTHAEAVARAEADLRHVGQDPAAAAWDTWLVGTPDEITDRLHAYMEAGITNWIISMQAPFDLSGFRLFAEQVIPRFR